MSRRGRGGLNFGKQRKKFNMPLFKEILSWILEIIIVVAIAYVTATSFGYRTSVVGQAMEPTLQAGELVFLDRISYVVFRPKADDVVVFLPNGNEKSHYYVRRVIATPGQRVQIKDGAVYVDGVLHEEAINVSSIEEAGMASEEILLGKEEYFVLGDNRNNSDDSRFANVGMVKKDYILGRVWYRYSSVKNMGFVK